jgi:hypothetical protein
MRQSNDGMPCAKGGTLHPFLGMPCPFLPMHCPFLPMLHAFLAMLHAFAATQTEAEDAVHQESRAHRPLHRVPDPSRVRRSECVGSDSERATMRTARVGMPREPVPSGRALRDDDRADEVDHPEAGRADMGYVTASFAPARLTFRSTMGTR